MLEFDVDNDGMLDFEEFKLAIKFAQGKMKNRDRNEDGEFWDGLEKCQCILYKIAKIYIFNWKCDCCGDSSSKGETWVVTNVWKV